MAPSEAKHQPQRTCYVVAPAGVPIDTIARVLQQRNIVPISLSEPAATNGSLSEEVGEAISHADLFIAVLGRSQSNSNVFFELGYAYALRKRLLVVAPPDSEALPTSLMGLLQVTADPQNYEAIRFALDQVLAAPRPPRRTRRPSISSSRPIGRDFAQELMGKLDRTPSEKGIEDAVVSAIMASGISVIERSVSADPHTSVDLGIWSDDLDTSVGNPLLIEVKAKLRDREELMQIRSQMQRYLQATNARTALVLYLDGPKDSENLIALSMPNILFMSVREMLERLQIKGFGTVIRELRNRVAHRIAA